MQPPIILCIYKDAIRIDRVTRSACKYRSGQDGDLPCCPRYRQLCMHTLRISNHCRIVCRAPCCLAGTLSRIAGIERPPRCTTHQLPFTGRLGAPAVTATKQCQEQAFCYLGPLTRAPTKSLIEQQHQLQRLNPLCNHHQTNPLCNHHQTNSH